MGETGRPSNTYYRALLKYCLSQATAFTLFLADKAGFWRRNSGFGAYVTRLRAELSGLLQPLGPVAYPVLVELLLRLRAPVPGVHPQELELLSKSRVYAGVIGVSRRSPAHALRWFEMGNTLPIRSHGICQKAGDGFPVRQLRARRCQGKGHPSRNNGRNPAIISTVLQLTWPVSHSGRPGKERERNKTPIPVLLGVPVRWTVRIYQSHAWSILCGGAPSGPLKKMGYGDCPGSPDRKDLTAPCPKLRPMRWDCRRDTRTSWPKTITTGRNVSRAIPLSRR